MLEKNLPSPDQSSSPDMIIICLYTVACLCTAGGALGAFWIILRGGSESSTPAGVWMSGLGVLLTGFAGGAMFWAMGWIVKQKHTTIALQQRLLQHLTDVSQKTDVVTTPLPPSQPSPVTTPATDHVQTEILNRIVNQLNQLNTNVLMTAEQRKEKYQQARESIIDQLSQQISDAIENGQLDNADALTNQLAGYADKSLVEVFREKIINARQKTVQLLVEGQSQRVADLMAVSRFDEAVDLAKNLHGKFPSSPEVNTLLERVKHEAQTFTQEQCRRLYAEIESAARARQWKAALTAAHKLMEQFPDTPQAKQTRAIMPTIVDNTRIEEVRDLRTRIIDMMERHRYSEALELANHVMENYPETAAADELRNQIANLRELSKSSPR